MKGLTEAELTLATTTLSVIVVVAVVGNLLVCAAIASHPNLRRLPNSFVVSLAIADILVSVVVMIPAIVNDVRGAWPFGFTFCRMWHATDIMCCTASILNLCVASLDRYMWMRHTYRYREWMDRAKACELIALAWFLSALISIVPVALDKYARDEGYPTKTSTTELSHSPTSTGSETPETVCLLQLNEYYAVGSSMVSFYAPAIIILFCYVRILQATRRRIAAGSHVIPYKRLKTTVTLGFLLSAFFICWTPFFVVNVTVPFCKDCFTLVLWNTVTWLGYFNSCVNPFIYISTNKALRHAVINVACLRISTIRSIQEVHYAGLSMTTPTYRTTMDPCRTQTAYESSTVPPSLFRPSVSGNSGKLTPLRMAQVRRVAPGVAPGSSGLSPSSSFRMERDTNPSTSHGETTKM